MQIITEEWRPVVGYENRYEVSNFGNVKSLKRDIITSRCIYKKETFILKFANRTGYHVVKLYDGLAKGKSYQAHRLVAISFIPNPNNYPFINHKNGIKNDNRVENLEWCTNSQNVQHAYDTGLTNPKRGEQSSSSILKTTDVLYIRDNYGKNGNSYNSMAKQYNTAPSNIFSIVKRKSWAHV